MTTRNALVAVALMALLAGGCRSRLKAPTLDNNPVYVNKQVGLRFLVPEGWTQQQRADLPPDGALDGKERTLVMYQSGMPGPSSMDFSVRDIDENTDIGDFLVKRKRSGSGWTKSAPPEAVEYGGRKGTRYFLKGSPSGRPTSCEIVAFRDGGRVYFFGGFFPSGNAVRRAQVRQFLAGLTWGGV